MYRVSNVVLLALLAACGLTPFGGLRESGLDSGPIGIIPDDFDGDGSRDADDCDPEDDTVYPGAAELCDEKDNDCNSIIDDTVDSETWYQDADEDGAGSDTVSVYACSQPDGYVAASGDCNDADASVHPGVEDYCDGVDSDCDGTKDEDQAIWYPDADHDGYGDDGGGVVSCDNPGKYLLTGGDCNDSDGGINPGETDDDCDGVDDDCDVNVDEDGEILDWHYDFDQDGYGGTGFSVPGCESPYPDMITDGSDCNDTDDTIHPGVDDICGDTIDQDCSGTDC